MSTQFDTPIVDLDRTDELPVLDVAAYEASLAANEQKLARTDTWAVESLRAVDEPDDEPDESNDPWDDEPDDAVPLFTAARPSFPAESLTTNVEGILRRITELEAELLASHESDARLQGECDVLRAERAREELRIETLAADNVRLREDGVHSVETAQRLEQQLRERGEFIAALQKSLIHEKDVAAHLSQQLATKLMDCEKAHATIELRSRAIDDLTREAAELNQQLQRESATSADVTARLAVAEKCLQESHALLLEHDVAIGKKEAQLAQAQDQIRSLTEERDALRATSEQVPQLVAQIGAHAAELEKKDTELQQLRDEVEAARKEAESQIELLSERTDELDMLRGKCNEHETATQEFERTIQARSQEVDDLMAELRAAREEQAKMGMQLDKARGREKNLTDQIFSRDNQIAVLKDELAAHAEALATIRRDVSRIGERAEAQLDEVQHMLEPVEHDGPTLHLHGEVLTIGRTSENDICIPSKLISRCHARVLVGPTGVIIEDANSTNGCYVNGEQVRQRLLHDGDLLELGDMRYRLRTRAVRDRKPRDTKLRQVSSLSRRTVQAVPLDTAALPK